MKTANPWPCRHLTPSTPDERRRWDAALMRKTLRKELAARFAEVRQTAGQ